jgi:hypothetical protein
MAATTTVETTTAQVRDSLHVNASFAQKLETNQRQGQKNSRDGCIGFIEVAGGAK